MNLKLHRNIIIPAFNIFVRKPHVVEGYEPFPRFLSGGEMVI
ncbi:MAG TPA: hypothetical protein VJ991_12580 [Balneolales bacterium]|nr:hypothetical protein [Balneolales bacterium]